MERRMVGLAIKALSNQLHRAMDSPKPVFSTEITGMQSGVLDFIFRNKKDRDIFQKDIEAEFNIRSSTATGILNLMEKNGVVVREPAQHDARLKKIALTDKGVEIRRRTFSEIMNMEERIVKGLSEEDINSFFRIIDTMLKNTECK